MKRKLNIWAYVLKKEKSGYAKMLQKMTIEDV